MLQTSENSWVFSLVVVARLDDCRRVDVPGVFPNIFPRLTYALTSQMFVTFKVQT